MDESCSARRDSRVVLDSKRGFWGGFGLTVTCLGAPKRLLLLFDRPRPAVAPAPEAAVDGVDVHGIPRKSTGPLCTEAAAAAAADDRWCRNRANASRLSVGLEPAASASAAGPGSAAATGPSLRGAAGVAWPVTARLAAVKSAVSMVVMVVIAGRRDGIGRDGGSTFALSGGAAVLGRLERLRSRSWSPLPWADCRTRPLPAIPALSSR